MSSFSKYFLSPSDADLVNCETAADVTNLLFTVASCKSDYTHRSQLSNLRDVVDITPSGMTHSLYTLQLQVPSTHESYYFLKDTLTDAIVVDSVKEFLNSDIDLNVRSSKTPLTLPFKQASVFRRQYKYTWEGRTYRWELHLNNRLTLSRQRAGNHTKKYEEVGSARLNTVKPDQIHQTYTRFELNANIYQEVHDKLAFEHVTIMTMCLFIDNVGPGFAIFPLS
ncbi:hypothetical protein BGW37DRAFT_206461 [Umbelopsis sp. PMI_123]|jgi:hypothetical protein|nr:hypothetical protein BGW37DRAFT_206461 [Umbelopsis sp. PMI_123]